MFRADPPSLADPKSVGLETDGARALATPSTPGAGSTDSADSAAIRSDVRRARWFAVLTVLMTATQLRPDGVPGPAEILLIGYMGLSIPLGAWGLRTWRLLPGKLLAAITVFAAAGGYYSAVVLMKDAPIVTLATFFPYVYVLIVVEYVFSQPDPLRFLREWAKVFGLAIPIIFMVLFLVELAGLGGLTPFEIYVDGVRFKAWMANPNQTSAMLVIALVTNAKAETTRRRKGIVLGMVIVLGFATASDGMRLSAAVAMGVIVMVILLFFRDESVSATRMRLSAIAALIVGLGGVALLAPLAVETASEVATRGGQGAERVALWRSCWEQAERSPVFGFGTAPQAEDLFGKINECHSSFFDLVASAGVPVGLFYVVVTVLLFKGEVDKRDLWGVAFITQITVMLLFNYFLRYPQLWLVLLMMALETQRARGPETPDTGSQPVQRTHKELAHDAVR